MSNTARTSNRREERRPVSGGVRALLSSAALIALGLSSSGCGFSLFGHFIGWRPHAVTERRAQGSAPIPLAGVEGRVAEYREQEKLAPREPYWPFAIAVAYADADSLIRAELELRQALDRDPCYAPALSLLSKLEFDAGRHDEAIRMLEAARTGASACPGTLSPELLAGLALHYDAIDRPDLAEAIMNSVPQDARRSLGSSAVYLTLRGSDPAPAADLAESDVHRHPHSAVSQNNYGIVKLRAGDPDAARKAFDQAIEIDPKLAGPYYNLAILEKFYAFDDQAAARRFKEYRERASDDPDGLAQVFEKNPGKELAQKRSEK